MDEIQEENRELENNETELQLPNLGMYFDTMEEAEEYYKEYGRYKGFSTRIRSSVKRRLRSDDVTSVLFVCSHEGKYVSQTKIGDTEKQKEKIKRSCSTVKCDCKACLRVTHDKQKRKWKVSKVEDFHNHKLVTPTKKMKMRSNRHMPQAAKDMAKAFQRENLEIAKVPSIFGGYHIGFDNRDCYNHLRNVRQKELEEGDAHAVLTYFRKKQALNPQFFYAIQCDEHGRAINFFWVDSRSRIAYQYFGDVVSFDTTYRTNKYGMPFAPFTGVNHHYQMIQFGCALLQDETEVTFTWLFETWLEAMGGRPPISILTDQDLAMKGAIARILPTTHHRLCIWHIMKKFGEKLSHVYYKKSNFKKAMKQCIWSTYKKEDFKVQWKTLMSENGLQGKSWEWLENLYEIRKSWAPIYNRHIFFAGMNTTGRSEGVNAFFDKFVTSTTNLREFVVKYEQALKKIVKRETDEDKMSEHKFRIVEDNEFLMKHAAKVYTRNMFSKFNLEKGEANRYKVEVFASDDQCQSFMVKSKSGISEEFLVKLNLQTLEGNCECKNFEFTGMLCRHILKVFVREDVDLIPNHFILSRWKQEANKFRIIDSEGFVSNNGDEESEALRLSHMCQQATKLACIAAESNEAYISYMEALNELSKKISSLNMSRSDFNALQEKNDVPAEPPQILLLNPNISQTKGRKKDGKQNKNCSSSDRYKSGLEIALNKKRRKCHLCKTYASHDSRNCPLNQENI